MIDSYIHDYFDDKVDQHYHDVDDFVDLINDEIDVHLKNKYFHLKIARLFVLVEMIQWGQVEVEQVPFLVEELLEVRFLLQVQF